MAVRPKIIKGEDVSLTIQLRDSVTKEPFSLGGFTAATGYFANEDGTTLAVSGELVSADLGKVNFILSEVQSALLAAGEESNFEAEIDRGNDKKIVQFIGKLEVVDRLF